jgi:hypothetical protein
MTTANIAPTCCAHHVPQGQPCKPCLVERADAVAEKDPGFRYMLREVRGSRYATVDLFGSSRAPTYSELLAAVVAAGG